MRALRGRTKKRRARASPAPATLELVMGAINEGVYDYEIATDKISYSPRIYEVLEVSRRGLKTAADWRRLIHPEDLPAYLAAFAAHVKGKTPRFALDHRYRGRRGAWRWARQSGLALRDARGRAVRMIGSVGDITDLKRAEEALRASEERYELAMSAVNEGVYDWNIASGEVYYSDGVHRVLGLSPGELRNTKDWLARVHPDDLRRFLDAHTTHFKGRSERLECEYRYRATDGSWRWARTHGIAQRDAGGRAVRMIGSTGDITRRKNAEIELRQARDEATEALERQTATADILKVISASPTDVQPVFEAIARNAVRLCSAVWCAVFRVEDGSIDLAAHHGFTAEALANLRRRYPGRVADVDSGSAKCARERKILQLVDVENLPGIPEQRRQLARIMGFRTQSFIPMLREGACVGVIGVTRPEAEPFPDQQIALLQTFADQAVIAIENARLFKELEEKNRGLTTALGQQMATSEILRSMSTSLTDVQPVFDAIVHSGLRLLGGYSATLTLLREGELHLAAYTSTGAAGDDSIARVFPIAPAALPPAERSLRERRTQAIEDIDAADVSDSMRAAVRARGWRSALFVPMIRAAEALGILAVTRREPGAFASDEIALLETFSSQAVIAIENVRLFNETKEALERQTATAEILRVISSTPTDTQPVFDAIVQSARRLMSAKSAGLLLRRESEFFVAAYSAPGLEETPAAVRTVVLDPDSNFPSRVILNREVLHIPDWAGGDSPEHEKVVAKAFGFGSGVQVPLLREGQGIGALFVAREMKGPFHDKEIALLRSFADQAVIAIENVRLFNETKEALEQQTAIAEVLRVISSSPTNVKPVLDAVAMRAARICEASDAIIFMREADCIRQVAHFGDIPLGEGVAGRSLPLGRDMAAGRAIMDGVPVHIEDLSAMPPAEWGRALDLQKASGHRTMLAVPLMRENRALGSIVLRRMEVGPFTEKQITLLKTFADQAAIAIENVRLFKELEARTQALAKSVQQLTALGEVGQAIGSTLQLETVLKTIVTHAVKLTGLDGGVIYEYDEARGAFELRASENFDEESVAGLREAPIRRGEGAVGRAVAIRAPVAVPDTHAPDYPARLRELLDRQGFRAVLAVPLVREEHTIGALMVLRKSPGPFAPETVELLGTLASQSALAIQNARLFREIEEKGRQLETASQHKSHFLASMSHELRTPLNAILGFNEMIIDQVYGEVPEDMKAPLENIQSSGKHLLRLINNVLDLAKIEAGRMELALSDYLVQDTVGSVHATLKPLAAEKGLEFVAEVAADIPPAHGDAGRLAQCLMNLAGNSLKFTKQGRVAIAAVQRDGLLRFSVADTGIGIPSDKIGTLFTEFKQTDATIASEYGGTGLGLSITKKFVEMHGGRIWVESEPGRGSTFLFEIPLRVAR